MSFGWSAGDIASTIKLIHSIVTSLRDTSGAREQFQELETELFGLERALERIDLLSRTENPPPEIRILNVASLYCVETLQRFHKKIKPFEDSLGLQSKMKKLEAAPRMVRWQLILRKELPELRQYLMAHVGYLNLELSTASLQSTSRANKYLEEIRLQNDRAIALIVQRIDNVTTMGQTAEEIRQTVGRVWSSNNELLDMLRVLAERTVPPPNTRFTWVQEPIRFENALGEILPIASESNWDILEAIIYAQFNNRPGQRKVHAGEFELFENSQSKMLPINSTNCLHLRPGMYITMAIIIGQYAGSRRCPRQGCSSIVFSDTDLEGVAGTICSFCGTWVRRSWKTLPKPLRPPVMEDIAFQLPSAEHISVKAEVLTPHSSYYPERSAYKNISIYVTTLPPTPTFRSRFEVMFARFRFKKRKQLPHNGSELPSSVHIHRGIRAQWEQEWKSSTKGGHLPKIDNSLPATYTRRLDGNLSRGRAYMLTPLGTGHNWLSTCAKTFGFREDDQCVCGAQETVTHVLVDCPKLAEREVETTHLSPTARRAGRAPNAES